MKQVKPEIRVLGIDDSPFDFNDKKSKIIGCVFRGNKYLEGVIAREITVDGDDSTQKIKSMVMDSSQSEQIKVVITDGITFAGFNVLNMKRLEEETNLPVIAVSRNKPDKEKLKRALENVSDKKEKLELINKAGKVKKLKTSKGTIYYQNIGINSEKAREIIEVSRSRSLIPEAVRVSHMFSSALELGESKGRV